MRLRDKIAVVTGAASGLGRAIAERFVLEGAHVVVADRDEKKLAMALQEIRAKGGSIEGSVVDVAIRDEIQTFFADTLRSAGRIDILVNNAGVTRYRPFLEATERDWDAVLDVDLKGLFFCVQAIAPHMTERSYGKIVNISSAQGTGTTPHNTAGSPGGSSAYASAKAAVIQLTKTLARELGPHGVNVNCVAPGTFLTALTSASRTPEQVTEHIAFRASVTVLKRLGRAEELANAVLFLASDESSFITGHTLYVDGGRIDRM
jgi:NAD(P)-dependent dehydrogenase (short-subunit alcohol dehydrogenase family)